MLPSFAFNETELLAFALVLLRVSAFVVSWPVFSVYSVPQPLKVLFALTLSVVIFPVISREGLTGQTLSTEIGLLVLKEVCIGLSLGFITRMFFFAVSIGGNLIATSTGLANAQIFNPTIGATASTVEQFYAAIATLLFLAINGHHYFLMGLVQSFTELPLAISGTEIASSSVGVNFGVIGRDSGLILQQVTEAGIKISAPVMVAIFFTNVAMGILGRAVPQINVLITSMSVNFLAGLLVMIVAIPALLLELDRELIQFTEFLFGLMKSM